MENDWLPFILEIRGFLLVFGCPKNLVYDLFKLL